MRLAVIVLAACGGRAAHEPPANSVGKGSDPPPLACALDLRNFSLDFSLTNTTDRPRTVTWIAPYLPRNVVVTARGVPRTVEQPALDIGVHREELHLDPHGTGRIPSIVHLRFEHDKLDQYPYEWTIAGPPAPVEITAELIVDDDKTKLTCGGRYVPP